MEIQWQVGINMFSKERIASMDHAGERQVNVKTLLKEKIAQKRNTCTNGQEWLVELKNLVQESYANLNVTTVKGATLEWIVITRCHEDLNTCESPQIQVCIDKSYKLKVYSRTLNEGIFTDEDPCTDIEVQCTLSQLSDDYSLCPGIKNYQSYFEKIRFDSKHVRRWTQIERIDASDCTLWIKNKVRKNKAYMGMCDRCVVLVQRLNELVQNAEKKTTPEKLKRQQPSSNRALKYMSPASQKKRKQNQHFERNTLKRLLKKIKGT